MVLRAVKVVTSKKEQLSMTTHKNNNPSSSKVVLREWQEKAKDNCLGYFAAGKRVWVQEAVTGAGKTLFARETAVEYYLSKEVDLIIILTPSLATLSGWTDAFKGILNTTKGPQYPADTQVWVSTYAGYKSILAELSTGNRRITGYLLIADEYHHAERDAYWGNAVTSLSKGAKNILMLSGTPWKTEGTIAFIDEESNIKGYPYYNKNGIVEADNVYGYADDLTSKTRGTVPVHFVFHGAKAKSKDTGRVYELDFDPDDKDDWQKYADEKCTEPLGKFVAIPKGDFDLESAKLAKNLIKEGVQWLNYSRNQIKQSTGVSDASLMLVVCKSIDEARTASAYIERKYQMKAEVIVSDDDKSVERLKRIKEASKQCTHDRPDVIVSVNMISEGVDIPAIKTIVYLSAIITPLYLTQVIGRGLRRIWMDAIRGYADTNLNQTMAYFVAPAHPYIMWFASKIEDSIKQARKVVEQKEPPSKRKPENDGEFDVVIAEYLTDSTGNTLHVCRSNKVDKIQLFSAIDRILEEPNAADHLANTMWRDYLVSLIVDGKSDAVEEMIRVKCQEIGIHYEAISTPQSVEKQLSYDERSKIASQDARELVKQIRYHCRPYKSISDDSKAFPKVWRTLKQKSSILDFSKATLDEKERLINIARNYIKNCEV